MGLSRQEHWSGLPFPSPGDLPDPGIEPQSPALQADFLPPEPQVIWTVEHYFPHFFKLQGNMCPIKFSINYRGSNYTYNDAMKPSPRFPKLFITEVLQPSSRWFLLFFSQPLVTWNLCSVSMKLPVLDISQKWTHIVFVILCLTYFTQRNILQVHPHGSMRTILKQSSGLETFTMFCQILLNI